MATQPTTPIAGTRPHPALQAPAGTKCYTTASVQRSDGSDPFLVYSRPARGYEPASTHIRRVPAAVAAADLAWSAESPAPRLATDPEVAAHVAAMNARGPNTLTT